VYTVAQVSALDFAEVHVRVGGGVVVWLESGDHIVRVQNGVDLGPGLMIYTHVRGLRCTCVCEEGCVVECAPLKF
jgi:hypothetical protein